MGSLEPEVGGEGDGDEGDDDGGNDDQADEDEVHRSPVTRAPKAEAAIVTLTVPVLEHGRPVVSYLQARLTPRQSRGLRLLFDGLHNMEETVRYGSRQARREPVTSQADAIRWLLDAVADAAGLD